MIKIPSYNVVIPETPTLQLSTVKRVSSSGDRNAKTYHIIADDMDIIRLPFDPVSKEWVEVYVNGIRLINPRAAAPAGTSTLFEVFNVLGNTIKFMHPIIGTLDVICDAQPSHWWGALLISTNTVQTKKIQKTAHWLPITNWPILRGTVKGTSCHVNYLPGPEFLANSYIRIEECTPTIFNGNYQVISNTRGSVSFRSNVVAVTSMQVKGKISGFGNITVSETQGIGIYSEPVVITQPLHGYARLSTDRKSIAYVPNVGYVGNDTFSWTMITQHGQVGVPECVNIKITESR